MKPVTGLALGRIAIGTLAFASPTTAAKAFQLQGDSPHLPYMTQMFGSREIALGLASLIAPKPLARRLVVAGIAIDAADAAAAVMAFRSGSVTPVTGAFLAAPAVSAVAVGVMELAPEKKPDESQSEAGSEPS